MSIAAALAAGVQLQLFSNCAPTSLWDVEPVSAAGCWAVTAHARNTKWCNG